MSVVIRMICRPCLSALVLVASCPWAWTALGQDPEPTADDLKQRFVSKVQPFVTQYCTGCHGEEMPAAQLRLDLYPDLDSLARHPQTWRTVLERLEAGDMPPAEAERQPTEEQSRGVAGWIREWRRFESQRNAGDPGPVPARRLSNAELDATIRDLTGFELRPSREFPIDPANEAGFDNSGESLRMSPALFRKYLDAMRGVADHVVLAPDGLRFAPHPVATDTDRDKFCVQRIVAFYRRQPVDLRDYFVAAWRYQHRATLGQPGATIEEVATATGVSPRYLGRVVSQLTREMTPDEVGPLSVVRALWREFPAPASADDRGPIAATTALRDLVKSWRQELRVDVPRLKVAGISDGTQPFVLWRNGQMAARHRDYAGQPADDLPRLTAKLPEGAKSQVGRLALDPQDSAAVDRQRDALQEFCALFPDAFFVDDRGPYFDPKGAGQGRLLTAGFHLMQGFFRDDQPLRELILDDGQTAELDRLWHELDVITDVLQRQYQDYIFFERAEPPQVIREAEFDFARSEDRDCSSPEKLQRLAKLYLERTRQKTDDPTALKAIEDYYQSMDRRLRGVEQARLQAEPRHIESVLEFASRAWRRPLAMEESQELRDFYQRLRTTENLPHDEAIRDSVAAILLAPQFYYRYDQGAEGTSVRPLTERELASRLSYFLWSSLPDAGLREAAERGELRTETGLSRQIDRMLADQRVLALVTEFGGQWLDFRRFEDHNAVDRERFPGFTNELRQAMFEEPRQFLLDLLQHDRPLDECLTSRRVIVNERLAKHYGLPHAGPAEEWLEIPDATAWNRGGLLTMGVFLTANSPGLRTSPVKRGYWVVRRLLGEEIPPPPPVVPELPRDEQATGELTIPQLLARHREHRACAGCHQRFDALGVVFEGYGPVGEHRKNDLAGRIVQTRVEFPDGREREGVEGLREYLVGERRRDFVDSFNRRLLAYALGRSLLLSDEPLLEQLAEPVAEGALTFRSQIVRIVLSPQFLRKRGGE
jgi:mono/diheme cytochrome c family protein